MDCFYCFHKHVNVQLIIHIHKLTYPLGNAVSSLSITRSQHCIYLIAGFYMDMSALSTLQTSKSVSVISIFFLVFGEGTGRSGSTQIICKLTQLLEKILPHVKF